MAKKRNNAAPAEEVKAEAKTTEANAAEATAAEATADEATAEEATDDATPAESAEAPKKEAKPVFNAPLVDIIKINQFKRNNPRLYKLLIDEYEATKCVDK